MSSLRLSLILLATIVLASCSTLEATDLPTPFPTEYLPTVIALTVEAQDVKLQPEDAEIESTEEPVDPSPTPEPIPTDTPTTTISPPIILPTDTLQPTQSAPYSPPPEEVPLSNIQILSPGPSSKVISPFIMRAAVKPGPGSVVLIELLGEDGRLLMREVRNFQSVQNEWVSLGSEVEFGINAVAESGRIQIIVEDEHGRLKSLSSVDLILQSIGEQDLNQPVDQHENIYIESPSPNRLIQGGTMRVEGLARTRASQPLMIELRTSDGRIVGTRQVSVTPSPDSAYGNFAIDVPYTVDSTNKVRVQVWESGDRIPGIVNLSSLEVSLSP